MSQTRCTFSQDKSVGSLLQALKLDPAQVCGKQTNKINNSTSPEKGKSIKQSIKQEAIDYDSGLQGQCLSVLMSHQVSGVVLEKSFM